MNSATNWTISATQVADRPENIHLFDRTAAFLDYYNTHFRLKLTIHLAGWLLLGFYCQVVNLASIVFMAPSVGFYTGVQLAHYMLEYYLFTWLVIRLVLEQKRWSGLLLFLLVHYLLAMADTYAIATLVTQGYLRIKIDSFFKVWQAVFHKSFLELLTDRDVIINSLTAFSVLPIAAKVLKVYAERFIRQIRLRNEAARLELNYLKAQVSPHFLFNTLNNVYSLALKKDARTVSVVRRLKELMSYSLYDTQAVQIPIREEVRFLQDYIELERLRHGPRVTIDFRVRLNGNETGQLPPLLLLPFVENAFKHGLNQTVGKAFALFELDLEGSRLRFRAVNSAATAPPSAVGGIGLRNVRRRLAMLYPSRHELQIEALTNRYQVMLTLLLD